jgi:hypothetical protein
VALSRRKRRDVHLIKASLHHKPGNDGKRMTTFHPYEQFALMISVIVLFFWNVYARNMGNFLIVDNLFFGGSIVRTSAVLIARTAMIASFLIWVPAQYSINNLYMLSATSWGLTTILVLVAWICGFGYVVDLERKAQATASPGRRATLLLYHSNFTALALYEMLVFALPTAYGTG